MNIAVIDVAAEYGGALSVLLDFAEYVEKFETEYQWFFLTSVVKIEETDNVHCMMFPMVKKSWFHRIYWEHKELPKITKKLGIDIVVSLQNNGFPRINCSQIVFFHNILLIQKIGTFSFMKKAERYYAIYSNFIGPYIRNTWEKIDLLVVQAENVKQQLKHYGIKTKIEVISPSIKSEIYYNNKRIKGYIYPATGVGYKNHQVIIDAEKKLNEKGLVIEILFTIDGRENEYAKGIAKQVKMVQGIKCIGKVNREKLFEYYKNYGLIMTSRFESFGMPLMEAKNFNSVIVGLDYPYIRELVDGYNRAYIAKNENGLAQELENGLVDENDGNYISKPDNSWGRFVSIIRNIDALGE